MEFALIFSLSEWFEFETPPTRIPEDYVENCLDEIQEKTPRPNAIVIWLGNIPSISFFNREGDEEGEKTEIAELIFYNKREEWLLQINVEIAQFLYGLMPKLIIDADEAYTFSQMVKDFNEAQVGDFEEFLQSDLWLQLRANGLMVL